MDADTDSSMRARKFFTHKVSPPHPQKLWPEAMRCDEILRSEEGDIGHHT